MERNKWIGKNVFVTGGTSGLGRALALQLEQAGANVAILARTQRDLERLTREHQRIIGFQGDVSDKEQIYPIAGQVQARLGDIDALFNVASYLGTTPLRLLLDTECEDFEKTLQTNLLGPFRLSKALLAPMLLKRQGLIVNISSDAAISPYPRWGTYGSSKAALDQLSRIFNEELKDHGVRVFSIDPGDMNTPMHFAAIPNADPSQLRDPGDSAKRILESIARADDHTVRRSV